MAPAEWPLGAAGTRPAGGDGTAQSASVSAAEGPTKLTVPVAAAAPGVMNDSVVERTAKDVLER